MQGSAFSKKAAVLPSAQGVQDCAVRCCLSRLSALSKAKQVRAAVAQISTHALGSLAEAVGPFAQGMSLLAQLVDGSAIAAPNRIANLVASSRRKQQRQAGADADAGEKKEDRPRGAVVIHELSRPWFVILQLFDFTHGISPSKHAA